MKKTVYFLFVLFLICIAGITCTFATNSQQINVLLNGKAVNFTDSTGYPYIDENSRTMVPLRATMETAGFSVGYDNTNRTAIVITEHNRIEVPIGTNIVYCNNNTIQNDTTAVIKNGRTYLPIRAVLEAAHFTVEWDSQMKSVNAYTYQYNDTDFSPYSTSSLATLAKNILEGNVVYMNGQYYATPEYVKLLSTVQVNYQGSDLNTAILPGTDRFALANTDTEKLLQNSLDSAEWVTDSNLSSYDSMLHFGHAPHNGEIVYAFIYSSPLSGTVQKYHYLDSLPADSEDVSELDGVYDGISIKKKGDVWYFKLEDLKRQNII